MHVGFVKKLAHLTLSDSQIEAAGAFEQVPKTIMTARPAPRVESPLAADVTAPDLPPVTGPYPSLAPPPLAPMSGFEPASPYPAAAGAAGITRPSQPLTGGYLDSVPPYAMSQATASAPAAVEPVRWLSYYIFLDLATVALFAVSMFVTILVLR